MMNEFINIMISSYPIYDKKYVFKDETINIDNMLEFITIFRNKKAELKLKDFEIITNNENTLLRKMLKVEDKIVSNSILVAKLIKFKE